MNLPTSPRTLGHTAVALLGASLWGLIEFAALSRARWHRRPPRRRETLTP